MREIKFRAWDKNECKMAEVTQIIFSKVQYTLVKYRYKTDNGKVDEASYVDEKGYGSIVLMQYTGLQDRNGKEIYEGDIYHMGDKNIRYVVVWNDTGLTGKQLGSSSYAGLSYWQDIIEIIGDIYENPELLEVHE